MIFSTKRSHRHFRARAVAAIYAAAALAVTFAISSCRHERGINDTDDTTHVRDTTHVHDTTSHTDSSLTSIRAGTSFDYEEHMAQNGPDQVVATWQDRVDRFGVSAFGETNTFHLVLAHAYGGEQQRRFDPNGDLDMYCSEFAPTGGMPEGTEKTALGTSQYLNRWITWPMSARSGKHLVLNRVIPQPNSWDWKQIIWMEVIDTEFMQTPIGRVKAIHYIETDSTGEMYTNGGMVDGDVAYYHQWYAPSLGVFIKSESYAPVGMGNELVARDTLVGIHF